MNTNTAENTIDANKLEQNKIAKQETVVGISKEKLESAINEKGGTVLGKNKIQLEKLLGDSKYLTAEQLETMKKEFGALDEEIVNFIDKEKKEIVDANAEMNLYGNEQPQNIEQAHYVPPTEETPAVKPSQTQEATSVKQPEAIQTNTTPEKASLFARAPLAQKPVESPVDIKKQEEAVIAEKPVTEDKAEVIATEPAVNEELAKQTPVTESEKQPEAEKKKAETTATTIKGKQEAIPKKDPLEAFTRMKKKTKDFFTLHTKSRYGNFFLYEGAEAGDKEGGLESVRAVEKVIAEKLLSEYTPEDEGKEKIVEGADGKDYKATVKTVDGELTAYVQDVKNESPEFVMRLSEVGQETNEQKKKKVKSQETFNKEIDKAKSDYDSAVTNKKLEKLNETETIPSAEKEAIKNKADTIKTVDGLAANVSEATVPKSEVVAENKVADKKVEEKEVKPAADNIQKESSTPATTAVENTIPTAETLKQNIASMIEAEKYIDDENKQKLETMIAKATTELNNIQKQPENIQTNKESTENNLEENKEVLNMLLEQFNDWKAKSEQGSKSAPRALEYTRNAIKDFCEKNKLQIPQELSEITMSQSKPKSIDFTNQAPEALNIAA